MVIKFDIYIHLAELASILCTCNLDICIRLVIETSPCKRKIMVLNRRSLCYVRDNYFTNMSLNFITRGNLRGVKILLIPWASKRGNLCKKMIPWGGVGVGVLYKLSVTVSGVGA